MSSVVLEHNRKVAESSSGYLTTCAHFKQSERNGNIILIHRKS
jgi:hypothetical protein